jgi:hypothetical protein
MYSNPFVNQLLAKERMEDAMRRSERTHLIRAVENSKKSRRWHLPMTVVRQVSLRYLYARNASSLESVR